MEEDFEFTKILSHLRRQFNILQQGTIPERKAAIKEIKEYLNEWKVDLEYEEMDNIMLEFSKILLASFSDPSDMIRETSIQILREILSRLGDLDQHLKYIFSILVERTNCDDLEGFRGLDEKMIPAPGQKPNIMKDVVETSEVARLELLDLFSTLIECMDAQQMRGYINESVCISRVFLMDPMASIQVRACRVTSELATKFKELLYHFTVIMSRAILLPLISKKSNVKIAALQTLNDILKCGSWKYTVDVYDVLVGFRDPNSVPIRDFYEYSHNINYFALFINHKNVTVREAFLRFVGDILMFLPDKCDIEARMVPYLLSGFFDDHKSIQASAIEIME